MLRFLVPPPHVLARCAAASAAALLLCAPLTHASAQAPLPALPSDSVARRAVDPARMAGRPYVVLLDEGTLTVDASGRTVQRTRQVLQVLEASVAPAVAERAYGYASSRQQLTIEWARVLRPNGEVVSDKPAQVQDSDIPAAMANPICQEQKVRRLSLAGVAVGTIVDVAFTLEDREPIRVGDFLYRWTLNRNAPVLRSQFTLDAPEAYAPRIVERNVVKRRAEVVENGRRRSTWVADEMPEVRGEPFAADSNGVVQSITLSAPGTWTDLARWYDGLARDRYALSVSAAARVDSVVRASGANTRADTIRAVHRWVAQDIRYVSVSLGIGGYQPRTPDEVLRTSFGDCKDKTTLFVAALRRYQMTANPVLLSLATRPDSSQPSVLQFNHAIAAVREGNRWVFTDLTAETVPYGEIPETYQGSFGIVVLSNANAESVTFPATEPARNINATSVTLVADTSGRVTGRITESPEGSPAHGLRAALSIPLDSARRAELARSLAQRTFGADVVVDSIEASNGRDLTQPPRLSYHLTADRVVRPVGGARLMTLPASIRGPARAFRTAVRELEARGARVMPIDAARLLPPVTTTIEVRITLPVGWTAELPSAVSTTSFFGSYQSTWSQKGREVRLLRRIQGQRGVFPPARMAEVIVWLNSVGADDQETLTLMPAPTR